MALAQPMKTAQATPQKEWNRCGTTINYAVARFTGVAVEDADLVASVSDSDSDAATFADDSVTQPTYVFEYPGGNYVTHKFAIGVLAYDPPAHTGIATFAYRRKNAGSNEVFGKVTFTIDSDSIPFTDEDIEKYVPEDLRTTLDFYWVGTYTLSLNAAHGGISVAASIPPTMRYDFNGNHKCVVAPNCATSFVDDARSAQAILCLWCDQ